MKTMVRIGALRGIAVAAMLLMGAVPGWGQEVREGQVFRKGSIDGVTEQEFFSGFPGVWSNGRIQPAAIPDVFGPGKVLNVGNVVMKVTNWGCVGNPFTNVSSDPSGQWPGVSGIEYLNAIALAVGAVNPLATDPLAVRRVSYFQELRPPTLDPEDRIYQSYDGIINGTRYTNDDTDEDPFTGEELIDEDFYDGRDNDGDGAIDEDFGALGQQMFSCVLRDDTPQAINATATEKHVPLGVEVRQLAWAYSLDKFTDFAVVEWTVINRSGHVLDSLVVGALVDMDSGPVEKSSYWQDDMDLSSFPSGEFIKVTDASDRRLQDSTMRNVGSPPGIEPDSALCPRYPIRINGFSIVDDDADESKTTGIPSMLLISHTTDPLGLTGPSRVGFTAFRAYTGGTPYNQGGRPNIDRERFELMVGTEPNNVNEQTGMIEALPGDQKGDYVQWWSVGPWRNVPDGGSVQVTIAFMVMTGDLRLGQQYASDYAAFQGGAFQGGGEAFFAKYPSVRMAFDIQDAYEGVYLKRPDWPYLTTFHGRETPIKPARGEPPIGAEDCRDQDAGSGARWSYSTDEDPQWFDFDCNWCTGAYDAKIFDTRRGRQGMGMFHRTWNAEAPPPNPNLNVAVDYNYTDNPDSNRVLPSGDNQIVLAWDNLSEVSADPKTGWFDFRGYQVWKVSDWNRPVGSAGPSDEDWSLIGEFRQFYYRDVMGNVIPNNLVWRKTSPTESTLVCPEVFVPSATSPYTGRDTAMVMPICLELGDLWDQQSGIILKPDPRSPCIGSPGPCIEDEGCINGRDPDACGEPGNRERRARYPVGRYRLMDREVKNGFPYFYSVTAFDSTRTRPNYGRRSAVEAEGVTPQGSAGSGRTVWVVPNPYRGFQNLADRPSSWDLTPNASDPTGTHIDFFGLPGGKWTIKIFTVSGDLVAEIRSDDAVNESIRGPVTGDDGIQRPGYTRQQDGPNDGQARWNLISRNGQDIVSGIYLFTVDSSEGTQRGKFVVIR